MLLLAADTSGKNGSIALAQGHPDGTCDLLEVVPLEGGTFSAQLIPQVVAILQAHQFKKEDLEGFAVVSGPGSFTGLRVGLAAIKALAEVLGKPIAAVSLLEAVATSTDMQGPVLAALDAGRNQAYVGSYRVSESGAKMIEEKLVDLSQLESSAGEPLLTPDQKIADAAAAKAIAVQTIRAPQADSIARIGWKKILAGDTTSVESLDANYIRRSDAEIFSQKNA
jgi:tRNA threonylcarbamoyladenosine biosynthesis protein TsaB